MAQVTAVAWVRSLARELPHAAGVAKTKTTNKKQTKPPTTPGTSPNANSFVKPWLILGSLARFLPPLYSLETLLTAPQQDLAPLIHDLQTSLNLSL